MIIRPVRSEDTDAILALAKTAGVGMTTLPDNRELIAVMRVMHSPNPTHAHHRRNLKSYLATTSAVQLALLNQA